MIKLGSHVGMSGKEMFLGSAREAASYGANTMMIYTGAPQNTKRRPIDELRIDEGWAYCREHNIDDLIIHAPYIINLANTVKPEIFQLAKDFLSVEIERTCAMGSNILVLHPGSSVGAPAQEGLDKIVEGLNSILTQGTGCYVALETMAGKGSELGSSFEELAYIYDHVTHSDKLRVCFDTCHTHDSGYDIVNDFDGVIDKFDRIIGKDQIAVFHINDSKNECGARKDRHANIGDGYIGFEALARIVHHPDFINIPKILETPFIINADNPDAPKIAPYKDEIARLRDFS